MMMTEIAQTAPGAAPDESSGAEQSDDSPSPEPGRSQLAPTLFNRLTGMFRHRNGSSLREDLTDALGEAHATDFSPAERAMLRNILRLREVRVEDVMIPRGDVQAVEISTTLGELLSIFEKSGHSRMPVYSETLDDPRGMVHIRDLLGHITRLSRAARKRAPRRAAQPRNGAEAKPAESDKLDLARVDLARTIGEGGLMRPILFVPPSMLASDLMARMQAARIQMALVIDEYGGTDGLVSLEDIVEMVVGDIEDEHDEDEPMVTKTAEGVFVVDGKAEIEEVAEMIGEAFKAGEHEEDVDTIGGMIFNTLGRVPARGEVVQAIPGFEFHVLDADPRRVKRVRIVQTRAADRRRRLPKPAAGVEA